MSRKIFCVYLQKEAQGLERPPYPGDLGKRIFDNISIDAWQIWLKHQTILINENRLILTDSKARSFLATEMEKFFFSPKDK